MRERMARAVCERLAGANGYVRANHLDSVALDGEFDMLDAMGAALDLLTANPGNHILEVGRTHMMENPDEGVGETFVAMVRAMIKEGK